MELFDFMSDEAFRASLEGDFQELEACMKVGAWKAVHVLAGSIIEAILLDYLVATDYAKRSSAKLSDMTLFEIINVCKQENILTSMTADLSHVIRGYRNFIHPEKLKRLGEKADGNSAVVAQALVKMVIEDVAARRRETYGNTADQIVTKIFRDPSVSSILGHLLKSTNELEMKRLLVSVIPNSYFHILDPANRPVDTFPSRTALAALEVCFRLAFDAVTDETKKEAAKQFVKILKEESADVVATYETAFFKAKDLHYYSSDDVPLVKHHFLTRVRDNLTASLLKAMEGIGKFLSPDEISEFFVDPLIRAMTNIEVDISVDQAWGVFYAEFNRMSNVAQDRLASRLHSLLAILRQRFSEETLDTVIHLQESIDLDIKLRDNPLPDEP